MQQKNVGRTCNGFHDRCFGLRRWWFTRNSTYTTNIQSREDAKVRRYIGSVSRIELYRTIFDVDLWCSRSQPTDLCSNDGIYLEHDYSVRMRTNQSPNG